MAGRRFFVGGNWKMNYSKAILEKVNEALGKTKDVDGKWKIFTEEIENEKSMFSGYCMCTTGAFYQRFCCIKTIACASSSTKLLSCKRRCFHR